MEPFQVKRPCGSKTHRLHSHWQVHRWYKLGNSLEVGIVGLRTPYKFPLILGLVRLTAVSLLEGQGGQSSHKGQVSCCLPQDVLMKKKNLFSLQKHGDFPTFISSSQLENLPGDVSMNLTTISALKLTKITKHLFFHMLFSYLHRCPCASQPFPLCCFCTRSVLFCQVQTFKSRTEMKVCSLHCCTLLSVLITLFIRTPSSVLF